jgi:uncharacterized protein YndB with AHSA1/START domain
MEIEHEPVAKAGMLIRRPVSEVFEAFVDPAVTSRFWFTRGSGRLEAGREVTWHWEMFDFSVPVRVTSLEKDTRIVVEWGAYGAPTTVELAFSPRAEDATFVEITNAGFGGTGDERVEHAIGSTEGFALVLAGLKAWLERGIALNLVPDRFPDAVPKR